MSQTNPRTAGPLTVVLVHGAFADASSWTGVIERLQKEGVQVTVPDERFLFTAPPPDARGRILPSWPTCNIDDLAAHKTSIF
jgi:hypothetical protein